MYRMTEIDNMLEIVNNNFNVLCREDAKKRYSSLCKKTDDFLLEHSQKKEAIYDIDAFGILTKHKQDIQHSYEYMIFTEKYYGKLKYNFENVKKNKMKIIMEELIMKALHPNRLIRHIELGGDIDDF
jgi:hypothetical protein